MKRALILIDIQNDYFEGGKNELKNTKQTLQNAVAVLENFRRHGELIYHVRHINLSENAAFFARGSKGSEIRCEVAPAENEDVFMKHRPNSFFETGLQEALQRQGVTDLVICGMMSHMCVDTTVRAAKDLDYQITVISDACTTKDLCWEEQVIPAEVVHGTMMAALSGTFATMITASGYIKSREG